MHRRPISDRVPVFSDPSPWLATGTALMSFLVGSMEVGDAEYARHVFFPIYNPRFLTQVPPCVVTRVVS